MSCEQDEIDQLKHALQLKQAELDGYLKYIAELQAKLRDSCWEKPCPIIQEANQRIAELEKERRNNE